MKQLQGDMLVDLSKDVGTALLSPLMLNPRWSLASQLWGGEREMEKIQIPAVTWVTTIVTTQTPDL